MTRTLLMWISGMLLGFAVRGFLAGAWPETAVDVERVCARAVQR